MKLLFRKFMLNIKKLILISLLVTISSSVFSNPFHKNKEEEKVPEVRKTASSTPEYLIELQMKFREQMASLMGQVKDNKGSKTLLLLLLIGFIYGAVHAAGPGHRKSVLFSIFVSNKSKWWEPALAGVISASVHGLSGIVLILIFKEFSKRLISARIDHASKYLETGSFMLLTLLALILLITKLLSLKKSEVKEKTDDNKKSYYYTVLLTSLFPCPGAILILILALSLNMLSVGILTVISLSFGMGITISLSAYLGRAGRIGLFRLLKSKEKVICQLSNYLELAGYLFLLLFSSWMLMPVYYLLN